MTYNNKGIHLSVIIFSLITSFLAALANTLFEKLTTFNFFSLSFWVVIPVGALCFGMFGASGGLFACKYFNIKPNKFDVLTLIVVGGLTCFLIYYLDYSTFVLDDGTKASGIVSFKEYMELVTTKSHLTIGRARIDTGETGNFGYFLLGIQFLAVLIGGFCVFAFILNEVMCENCNVYYKKIAKKVSNRMNAIQAEDVLEKMRDGTIESYRLALTSNLVDTAKESNKIEFNFTLMRCPKCKNTYIEEEVFAISPDGNEKKLSELSGRIHMPSDFDWTIEFKKNKVNDF